MKKAFTLIELLIVIAIIGILAGIVLISLTGALKKGKDSRIQADLQQVRNIAGMIMSDTGSYDGLCSGGDLNTRGTYGSQLGSLRSDILAQGSAGIACYASGTEYCVSAQLVATSGVFCIDSNGNSLVTSTACNTTSFTPCK
jgi:prepilin-type N-terminal cleavage/methylation domain-containing protein